MRISGVARYVIRERSGGKGWPGGRGNVREISSG